MSIPTWPEWMTLQEAEAYQPYDERTLRRAITKTADLDAFPRFLPSKRGSKNRIIIRRSDLDAWMESLDEG